ncbi:MAG TPA: MerR family DNA-binding transcriptional regulator [Magnetospirillaceae bacterium]
MDDVDSASRAEKLYSVAELARELGITTRTLRFYEDRGLVSPQRAGTTRIYSRRDRARMILILRGKRLGFSLREVKDYLDLYNHDHSQTEQLHVLEAAVTERINDLEKQRQALEETLAELAKIRNQARQALKAQSAIRA